MGLKSSLLSEKKYTYALLGLLLISIAFMQYFNAPLVNESCTGGIVSFELAKELSVSQTILDSWNEETKLSAAIGLGFDFLFLIVYSSFISLLIYKSNERLWKGKLIHSIGKVLIYVTFLAAAFDIVENMALIQLLLGDLKQVWSSIAYYFAVPKFIFLLISIVYILSSWVSMIFRKPSNL